MSGALTPPAVLQVYRTPVVTGGLTLTPAAADKPSPVQPAPTEVNHSTPLHLHRKIQSSPGANVQPQVSAVGGIVGNIVQPTPTPNAPSPVVVGSLTFNPILLGGSPIGQSPTARNNSPYHISQAISGTGGTYASPDPKAPDRPAAESGTRPFVEVGATATPVVSGAQSGSPQTNGPLGTVAGQIISGDHSHAVINGQTILPGSVATVSGTPVSLGGPNLVIGTTLIPLPSADIAGASAQPSAFSVAGTIVSSGGPPITVPGTPISRGQSGLVVGSSTVPLTDTAQNIPQSLSAQIFSIDGTGVTVGGPAVTISGTRISVGPSYIEVGSKIVALLTSSVFSVGRQSFVPHGHGFSIDGTILTPGGPAVTVAGTEVSLDKSSELIVGPSPPPPLQRCPLPVTS